jgi:RNA polymerase sigma factor (sigma-70 family)
MESFTSPNNADKMLWKQFKDGNKEALEPIYEKYYSRLLAYGMKIKNHEEFIEDCIQEIFCDLLNSHKNLGDTDNILFYLFISLRRKIFRKLKYDISFRLNDNFHVPSLPIAEQSFEETFLDDDSFRYKKKFLKTRIDRLPLRQKEAMILKFYMHYDYEAMARIMELNVQSVRNLVYKSLKSLREQLHKHG